MRSIPNPKIRFCPLCDALIWCETPVCEFCARLIMQEVTKTMLVTDREQEMNILSLFRWGPQSPQVVSELIYLLKGGRHPEVASWLAHWFWVKNQPLLRPHPRILIPAPSKSKGADHASVWTQALLREMKKGAGLFWSPFEAGVGVQKQKSRLQRQLRQVMQMAPEQVRGAQELLVGRELVFCDDVVATGSTALAAYQALGRPKSWTIWALAYRLKESTCQKG